MEAKYELHPDLQDASLEKACEMADDLHTMLNNRGGTTRPAAAKQNAADLSYMLEYLRLNFDLVPKK